MTSPFAVDELTIEDGLDIAMWRTPGPWAVQDSLESPRADEGYRAVRDAAGSLVGYCCFGEPARPLGMDAQGGKLDVALGIAPTHLGRGLSREVGRAVIDYARSVADGRRLRCAVAEWNAVARHTSEGAGFVLVGQHEVSGGNTSTTYLVYEQ